MALKLHRQPILANLRALLRHPLASQRRKEQRHEARWREYGAWIRSYDTLDEDDRAAIAKNVAALADPPRFSILMPVYNPPPAFLRAAIESVTGQLYPRWQLCIADDASPDPEIRGLLRGLDDKRIRIIEHETRGGISAASNRALGAADGEWVALLDHDDCLAPHALYMVAAEIAAHPDAAMLFTDEDAIDADGRRFQPYFKPDWNAALMLGQNAVSHLGVFRTALIRKLGGFRSGVDGSQDWDLALRVADEVGADRIRHVPHVLYHWRQGAAAQFSQHHSARAAAAGEQAVRDHLARRGEKPATIHRIGSWLQVVRSIPAPAPRVTTVIVASDPARVARQVPRLLAMTAYEPWRCLVVAGGAAGPHVERALAGFLADSRLHVRAINETDDASLLRNRAADAAEGEFIVFLAEAMLPADSGWLAALIAELAQAPAGAAGPLIVGRTGRIADGGLILDPEAIASPAHRGVAVGKGGYFGHAILAQDLSAVSGACLATRRDLFNALGGFDPDLPVHGDVDFCLRLRRAGHRIVWTPLARMRQSRPPMRSAREAEWQLMRSRWASELAADPFGNRNLAPDGSFALASPPRAPKPWRDAKPSDPL